MRQLRLRDIGGIIVIDFIDMAVAKNRAEVLKVLQEELEHDRTKTYLVEISPLGLVEMTRQNVTAGIRETLTRICPTCGGEGRVLSEQTMSVEAERRLRKLARSSGAEAFLVRMNARVATQLAGPGGAKLLELERETGKYFTVEPVERMPLTEVDVVREGSRAEVDGDEPARRRRRRASRQDLRAAHVQHHRRRRPHERGLRGGRRRRDRLRRPGAPGPDRPRQPHRRLRHAARREDDRDRARAGAGVLLRAAGDGARGRRAARAGAAHQAAPDAADAGEGEGRCRQNFEALDPAQ